MTFIKRLVGVLCLAFCFSLYSNAQDTTGVTTQTHNISDDGFANVPLQFSFPYYGQSFTNSWMFSNGIISFQDPNASGLAWSNLSVRQFSTTMGSQFDYSIYSLWTDLINISGTFRTEGSTEFQRYSWLGISPFYDPNRLNTFSVEIRPDGSISANYTLIDVNYASVGIVGKSSTGEFDQIYSSWSSVSTGSLSNWERYTLGVQQPPVEEPNFPQYTQVIETPTVTVTESNTGVETTPVVTQTQQTTLERVESNEQQQQQASSGNGISISSILNIVAREQARVSGLERSTIESSVEQSVSQSLQATEQAESIAAGAQADSILQNIEAQNLQESQTVMLDSKTLSVDQQSATKSSVESASISTEEIKTESSIVAGFTAVDALQQDTNVPREETQNEQKTQTVNRNAPDNDLAGNVSIAALGSPPQGFNLYSIGLPDGSFYAPREIYKNQRVVDNQRLLRGLTGGSDRLHQEMVDAQYR